MKALWSLFFIFTVSSSFASAPQKYRWMNTGQSTEELSLEIRKKLAIDFSDKPQLRSKTNLPLPKNKFEGEVVYRANEVVTKSEEIFAGVKIHQSHIQSIYDKKGNLQYQTGIANDSVPENLKNDVALLKSEAGAVLRKLQVSDKDIAAASHVFQPELEIYYHPKNKVYLVSWIVDFIDQHESTAWRYRFDKNLNLIEAKQAASHLIVGRGTVYPKGPKRSDVSEVFLHGLVGDGTLTSSSIRVLTANDQSALSPDHTFYYSASDARFDQVQAYYYMEIANAWFRQRLQVQLNNPVEVKVHVGGNRPTNAAFYYRNKIFLGAGDGRIYQNMLKDPTVVIHELVHAYIDQLTGLSNDGESGSFDEAYADYFSSAITLNPNVGSASYMKAPYRRTLNNSRKAFVDFRGKKYHDSTIISGTLWTIRQAIDDSRADQLALRSLFRLGKVPALRDFPTVMVAAMKGFLDQSEQAKVYQVLRDKGWLTGQ